MTNANQPCPHCGGPRYLARPKHGIDRSTWTWRCNRCTGRKAWEVAKIEGLLTLAEARAKGLIRVRQPQWVGPFDYLDLTHTIIARLYSPKNRAMNRRDPVEMLLPDSNVREWLPYEGPAADSAEYQADRDAFEANYPAELRR